MSLVELRPLRSWLPYSRHKESSAPSSYAERLWLGERTGGRPGQSEGCCPLLLRPSRQASPG